MNTYAKFCPNVFVAKCDEPHQKGDIITVTTKYGKENECEVWNLVGTKQGAYFYSITRTDGFNRQERALRKAERYAESSSSANARSEAYYQKSNDAVAGIVPGQPILVGHHSERRHRRDLERSWNAMGNAVKEMEKAQEYKDKAAYWRSMADKIDLSMPESIEYYTYRLQELEQIHQHLKDHPEARPHGYALQYAKKDVNECKKNLELAQRLWGDNTPNEQ